MVSSYQHIKNDLQVQLTQFPAKSKQIEYIFNTGFC